jgi:uncharacterized Zn finger protein (UPF0148 family)
MITGMQCSKCTFSEFQYDFVFCPYCGTQLIKQIDDKTLESENYQELTIEFHHSTSASFPIALNEASQLKSFKLTGTGSKSIYKIKTTIDKVFDITRLIEKLKPIRKKFVYLNGELTDWEEMFSFIECFKERQSSYKPELFCYGRGEVTLLDRTNIWGCIKAPNHDLWGSWGKWLSNKQWEFDKDRIRFELNKRLSNCRGCPAFSVHRIDNVLNALPATVDPFNDKNWTYRTTLMDEGAIRHPTCVGSYSSTKKVYGVYPKTLEIKRWLINESIGRDIF